MQDVSDAHSFCYGEGKEGVLDVVGMDVVKAEGLVGCGCALTVGGFVVLWMGRL